MSICFIQVLHYNMAGVYPSEVQDSRLKIKTQEDAMLS